ncbi:expressed unknown protein [Seminavis robusta]|uniref:Uncharacterized protein n=1 Tax=Seminavis robusta TaxID=568900 RepID=A0A9N8EKC6_9STRA|nr:expressed unknown protein [Seminavis robusta]|eukprot:Sro1352_g265310.1 n/a (285) ;mRNA; f:9433-10376
MDDNGGGKLPAKDAGLSNSALSVGMALIFVGNLIASDGESVDLATALGRAEAAADRLWMLLLGLAAENPTDVSHYNLLEAAQVVLQRLSEDRGGSTAFEPSAFRFAILDMVREDDEETPAGATRGRYKCGRCQALKKGHICPFEPVFFRRRNDDESPLEAMVPDEANTQQWSPDDMSLFTSPGGLSQADEPRAKKPRSPPRDAPKAKKPRYGQDDEKQGYNCGRCGVPKVGHDCPFVVTYKLKKDESLPSPSEKADAQGGEPSDNDHRERDGDNDDEKKSPEEK